MLNLKDYKDFYNSFKNAKASHFRKVKATTNLLMTFKKSLDTYNGDLHRSLRKYYDVLYKTHEKNKIKIYKHDIRKSLIKLINYISSWRMNIPQLVKPRQVRKKLGILIAEEHITLGDTINHLIAYKDAYYANSVYCKKFFNRCQDKKTFKSLNRNRKHYIFINRKNKIELKHGKQPLLNDKNGKND